MPLKYNCIDLFIFGCAGSLQRSLLLHRCFSGYGERGRLSSCRGGLLTVAASPAAEHRLESTGSIVVVLGLSCSTACGIFLNQGYNSCLLYWQADSLPPSHQGNPPGASCISNTRLCFVDPSNDDPYHWVCCRVTGILLCEKPCIVWCFLASSKEGGR